MYFYYHKYKTKDNNLKVWYNITLKESLKKIKFI